MNNHGQFQNTLLVLIISVIVAAATTVMMTPSTLSIWMLIPPIFVSTTVGGALSMIFLCYQQGKDKKSMVISTISAVLATIVYSPILILLSYLLTSLVKDTLKVLNTQLPTTPAFLFLLLTVQTGLISYSCVRAKVWRSDYIH